MELIDRLDHIIYKEGISQKEFFDKSGFPKSSYYNIKSGKKKSLRPNEARSICDVFGDYDYDWLMGQKELPPEDVSDSSSILELAENGRLGKTMLDLHEKLLKIDDTYMLWFDKEVNVRALKILKEMRLGS